MVINKGPHWKCGWNIDVGPDQEPDRQGIHLDQRSCAELVSSGMPEFIDTFLGKRFTDELASQWADANARNEGGPAACAGVVYRLDRKVSGCLLRAKTFQAFELASRQLRDNKIRRIYACLCHGLVPPQMRRTITARQPTRGEESAVEPADALATAYVDCIAHFARGEHRYSFCRAEIVMGEANQIRVQMSHLGNPLVSDSTYSTDLASDLEFCPRVFLHAWQVGFTESENIGRNVIARLSPDLQGALETMTLEADWTSQGGQLRARESFEDVLARGLLRGALPLSAGRQRIEL